MELIEAKVTALISLAVSSMLIGLLPACFSQRCRTNFPLLISAMLCFGGGVLLATSLVHMLPEIRTTLHGNWKQYAELLYCAGFFVLYLVDEVAHLCTRRGRGNVLVSVEEGGSSGVASASGGDRYNRNRTTYGAIGTFDPTAPLLGEFEASTEINERPCLYDHDCDQHQRCQIARQDPCPESSHVKGFGLIIALTVHAVLEGLAVGLEISVPQVLLLLTAISTHKLVVGFCLGVELTSSHNYSKGWHFLSISLFSFGSAAGIGMGMGISEIPTDYSELVLPILQALAAGTLLYVTVSEVLPRERSRWHDVTERRCAGVVQFVAVISGFVAMTVLTKYFES